MCAEGVLRVDYFYNFLSRMKIVHALVEIVYMYKDKKNQWLCKFVHQSKSYNFTKTPRAKTIKEIAAIFHALCR